MKNIERLALMIVIVGFLLKAATINHPGDEISMIGLTFLSLVYLVFGFALFNNIRLRDLFKRASYTTAGSARIIGGIALGISIWSALVGILFKLLHLAGGNQMAFLGGLGLLVILVVVLIAVVVRKLTLDPYLKNVFIKGTVVLILAIATVFISSLTLVKFFHRDDPKYIELHQKAFENPQDERAWEEFEEYKEAHND